MVLIAMLASLVLLLFLCILRLVFSLIHAWWGPSKRGSAEPAKWEGELVSRGDT